MALPYHQTLYVNNSQENSGKRMTGDTMFDIKNTGGHMVEFAFKCFKQSAEASIDFRGGFIWSGNKADQTIKHLLQWKRRGLFATPSPLVEQTLEQIFVGILFSVDAQIADGILT